ncbi:unnamed protein product, partial [Iphiclides podalirius]
MAGASISNIIFYRTCVHSLNHTKEECKDFLSPIRSNATRMLEEDVQKYATFVLTVKSVMESVTPAILSMFLGVWSDTYGRKPLIVWPIFASLNVISYSFSNVYIKESLSGALEGGLCKILDWLHVKEMVQECFKERPNHGRAQILLLTAARSIGVFVMYGTGGIEYPYTRRTLHWALQDYNTYSAVSTAIMFVGSLLGVVFIQRVLSISDLVLAAVAFLSAVVEYTIKAIVVNSWQMYLSVSVSLFKGLSGPLVRSFLAKALPVEDIAKVFAMMCAIEGLSPLIAPILFNSVYVVTLENFPGTVYFISGGLSVVCVVLLGFVQYYSWNAPTSLYRPLEEDEEI